MRKLLGFFAAFCWMVFGIAFVIRWIAGNGGMLAGEMLRTAPPEATGLPEKDYPGVGTMTAEYLTGKRETFQYVVAQETANGAACARTEVFQEHEAAHMADCRDLIRLDLLLCFGSGTAALLLAAAGLFRPETRADCLRGMLRGLGGFAVLGACFGIWALADFNGLFVTFHRVAFRNDGWLLNPKTDLLIRLMPTAFFIRLGIRGLIRFAVFAGLTAVILRAALRHSRQPAVGDQG